MGKLLLIVGTLLILGVCALLLLTIFYCFFQVCDSDSAGSFLAWMAMFGAIGLGLGVFGSILRRHG